MLTKSIKQGQSLARKITVWQWVMLIGLSGTTYLVMTLTQLGIGQTPSLPYRYYFTVKGLTPQLYDLASIKGHTTAYHPQHLSYVKRLAGVSGERITIKDNKLFIGGRFIGTLRTHTRCGQPLTPLKAQFIPQGYVFVSADHPHSFDSRYAEFGLVKRKHIQGKTWGWGQL